MKLPSRLADGGVALLLGRKVDPGADPHQVKGIAYRGHLEFIAEEMEGGLKAHLRALEELPVAKEAPSGAVRRHRPAGWLQFGIVVVRQVRISRDVEITPKGFGHQ